MPKVDLIATKSFGYNTRRLLAGDEFQARNAVDAMILTRVRKVAEAPKAKPTRVAYERQGSGYDAGAVGYELVGRDPAPKDAPKAEAKPKASTPKAGARARKAKAKK